MIAENGSASVYLIDEEYRLVYFNQVLRDKYPQVQVGDFCYERLGGEERPCEICPFASDKNRQPMYYNRVIKNWIHVEAGEVAWPGKGKCRIVLASSVQEDEILREMESIRMQMLIEYMPDSMILCSWNQGHMDYQVITNGLFRKYGYTMGDFEAVLNERGLSDFLWEEDAGRVREKLDAALGKEKEYRDVVRFRLPGGETIWASFIARLVLREREGITFFCVCSDITDIKRQEQETMMTSRKLESILRQAGVNGWDWNFKKNTLKVSGSVALFPAFCQRYFYKEQDQLVLGDFTEQVRENECIPEEYRRVISRYLERVKMSPPGKSVQVEFPLEIEKGRIVWLMAVCEVLWDENGTPVKAVGHYRNISEEHRHVLQLTQMAETDAMTGLYNRVAAITRIEEYIDNIGGDTAAMVMFDLDNFKQANDVFGHSFGDAVIVENARRLKQFFRKDDVICRIGGDEFMILCKNIREKDLQKKLERVIDSMTMVHEKDGQIIRFSASAGYVMIPDHGTEFDDLYSKTDMALFAAKLRGKSSFCRYSPDMKAVRYELAEDRERQPEQE